MNTTSNSDKPRGKPFVKGQPSANPHGRPKGFRSAILAKCGPNLEALVDFAWAVLTGEETTEEDRLSPTGEVETLVKKPTISERQAAARFLAEYAEGKPATKVEVSGEIEHNHRDGRLEQLREMAMKLPPEQLKLIREAERIRRDFERQLAASRGAISAPEGEVIDAEVRELPAPAESPAYGSESRESTQADQVVAAVVEHVVSAESQADAADAPEDDPFGGDE